MQTETVANFLERLKALNMRFDDFVSKWQVACPIALLFMVFGLVSFRNAYLEDDLAYQIFYLIYIVLGAFILLGKLAERRVSDA